MIRKMIEYDQSCFSVILIANHLDEYNYEKEALNYLHRMLCFKKKEKRIEKVFSSKRSKVAGSALLKIANAEKIMNRRSK